MKNIKPTSALAIHCLQVADMAAGPQRTVRFLDLATAYSSQRTELDAAWTRVMDSGRLIMGPELEQFEAEYAAWCGARHAIGVANGLDALYLALLALGIGPGDEVIVPAHTFVATWLAVVRAGATPVPAEPDPLTCLATAESIARRITPRTRAVIAVHLYGSVLGIEDIVALCRDRDIALIEDAAQAHGAASSIARAGNHGRAGCFSFYPSKNLGAFGDGGAVVTNDSDIEKKIRALRNYGSRTRYVHDIAGINSRLDELQAALLRVRLRTVEAENTRRQDIAALYLKRLSGIPGLQLPVPGPQGSHVWHLFVVQTDMRFQLQQFLEKNGCETLIHYAQPVYRMQPFLAYAPAGESVADKVVQRVLSLPIGVHLSNDDLLAVCSVVLSYFGYR